jgi:hypothetical protein
MPINPTPPSPPHPSPELNTAIFVAAFLATRLVVSTVCPSSALSSLKRTGLRDRLTTHCCLGCNCQAGLVGAPQAAARRCRLAFNMICICVGFVEVKSAD